MSRSIPLWTSSKNQAIYHRRVVGASSRQTSNTNAVYTKEKQYIKNYIWSVTAERKYMEGCNTFPRSRRNMSWYSASYIQIQIGYDRSLWANTHKTRGCWENNILYNIRHVSELSNANGGLQCTLHISAVNDHYIPKFPQKICTCISRRYIYSRQQNRSDVWEIWIVHWIYILIKWLKLWKYSDIYYPISAIWYIKNLENRLGTSWDTIISYPRYHSNGFVADN